MQELDDYIDKVRYLPPAPQILPQLLSLLGKPDTDCSRVVELIMYDPALTADVLKLCNSAFFASATPVADLQEAVSRLGFHHVYRTVAAVSGSRLMATPQKGYGFDAGELWKHSVAAALAAQCVAEEHDDDANVIFTATLLHDIGKIILADALEHIYSKLIEESEKSQSALLETEKKLLGVQHAEIGGRLLLRWNFPADIVAGVTFHHSPAAAESFSRLAAYIYVGNMIAHFMGFSYGHQAFAFRGRDESLEILGLKPEDLPPMMIKTFDQLGTVESLFNNRAG